MHTLSMDRSGKEEQPKRRNWVSALAPDAEAAGYSAFLRAGFADPTLVLRWEEIAGPETARLAVPVRLTQGPHGGVLTLKAEPGAAVFLQHETRVLCERINSYLGRMAVTRFKFVPGSLVPRPLPAPKRAAPGPVPPADPVRTFQGPQGLRDALLALARARQGKAKMAK